MAPLSSQSGPLESPPHGPFAYAPRLTISLALAIFIMVLEVVGGLLSNSLALLGDAGHVFADVLAITLSLAAMRIAARPHTPSLTFGYHRAEILAALINAIALIVITGFIFYEAYLRLSQPPLVKTPILLPIAVIGLVANSGMIVLLRKGSRRSLNLRGVYLHVLGDSISSVGVVIGAAIIAATSYYVVDPIVGTLIGVLILRSSLILSRDSINILLEGVPRHLKITKIAEAIKEVDGVRQVHDLHVWTITSGLYALSGHIVVDDRTIRQASQIVKSVESRLKERFNIGHSTIQVEPEEVTEIRKEA